jgi:peroxiredoxin
MANQLTGDFDLVGQAGVKLLNRLVRVMHQNGAKDPSLGLPVFRHRLAAHIEDASGGQPISGSAFVQVGVPFDPPVLQLVAGAPSDVRIRFPIRSRYRPDPGTKPLPEFLSGEVRARYALKLETESGVLGFRVVASPDDSEIGFLSDAKKKVPGVDGPLRNLVRTALQAFQPLPAEFQGAPPILLGLVDPAGEQAVAFPVSLSGAPGDPGSVKRVFAGSNEVAIGVSKEFILAPIQAQLDALKANPPSFTVKVKYLGVKVGHYSVTITKATATWSEGMVITITIKGKATTGSILPNASFSVTMKLKLIFSQGGLSVEAVGAPSVNVSVGGSLPGFVKDAVEDKAEGTLKSRVVKERDTALANANPLVQNAFAQTARLETLLRTIDDLAAVSFYKAEFDPDGLILRGSVKLSPPKEPRVEFAQLANGEGYTAFDSWIPGGWVERFHWSWYWDYGKKGLGGFPQVELRDVVDRFVLEEDGVPVKQATSSSGKGKVKPFFAQVCLSLVGSGGWTQTAKLVPWKACSFNFIGELPYPPKIPVTWPDPVGRKRVIAHVDPAGRRPLELPGVNLLVQRTAGEPVAAAVRGIEAAAREAARPEAALAVALVVPTGSFRQVAAEVARIRRARGADGNVSLLAVEDVDGSWSRAFDLPTRGRASASRLVDSRGRLVWRHDGGMDRNELAGALREHLQAAARPAMQLLRAGVRAGQNAPDFHFDGVSGGRLALRWLRGRLVVLVFAEAGASPSRSTLKGLARLQRSSDRYGLFPLAVVHAADAKATATLRRELRLGFPVVPDPVGAIGERYGIRCWPTTVVIDRDGEIAHVSLGAAWPGQS